jgi:methylenetetrahydrofolate reductase (NADPH)
MPLKGVEQAVAGLPREVRLTVTFSPAQGVGRTLEITGRLSAMGFRVVPHLAARFITGHSHLAKIIGRLDECRVREIFVIGGDRDQPAGEFPSAASLLDAIAAEGAAFDEIGIAGYPEPHPTIPDHALMSALSEKSRHATYLVSQICFDADAVRAWAQRMRERGIMQRIEVGIPGAVPVSALLRISAKVGVGQSLRFMRGNRGLAGALLGQRGTYRPDRLIRQLESAFTDPRTTVGGMHIYTFNDVERTEQWRQTRLSELPASI